MKHHVITLPAMVAFAVSGTIYAQEAALTENAEYEHLKVLEPLVGTYRNVVELPDDGGTREWSTKIFWLPEKKMLLAESRNRRIDAQATAEEKEWNFGQRYYYVWNWSEERIEWITVRPWKGTIRTSELQPQGHGVFLLRQVATTAMPSDAASQLTVTAKDTGLTYKVTNRKGPDGEALDDIEWSTERVAGDQ